ncbi:hypothetical protein ACFE04_012515 [Oxalis oulophora]
MAKEFNSKYYDQEEDEISLCDLAMDDDDDNYYSKETLESSSFDQDLFQFSSFRSSSTNSLSDSIIFCGKLFSYKENENPNKKSNKSSFTSQPHQAKQYNKNWSMSFSSDKYINGYKIGKLNNKFDYYPVKNVSIIATQLKSSSKWPFGVGRSPVEMDIKRFRPNNDKKNVNEWDRKSGKALCGLLNVLMFKKSNTTNKL